MVIPVPLEAIEAMTPIVLDAANDMSPTAPDA